MSADAADHQISPSIAVLPPSATVTGHDALEFLENGEEISTHRIFSTSAPKGLHVNNLFDHSPTREDVVGSPQPETLRHPSRGCGVDDSAECRDSRPPPPEVSANLDELLFTSRQVNANGSGPDAGDWIFDLAGLNSKLVNHRKSMSEFISLFRSPVSCSSPRPQWTPGLESANQSMSSTEDHESSRLCPVDETFFLALKLLRLLEQLYTPSARHPSPSEPLPPALGYSHSPQQSVMATSYDILADQANRLLLLSCYTRLLNIFCQFFGWLESLLTDTRALQTSTEASSFLTSILPCIKVGFFAVETIPKLQAIMVVDFAEILVDDICLKFETTASACISSNHRNYILHHYHSTTDDAISANIKAIRSEQSTFCRHIREFKRTLLQSHVA